MGDLIFLCALAMFFALMVGFVRLCDRVISVGDEAETRADVVDEAVIA